MTNTLTPLMNLKQAAELLFGDAGRVRALRTEIDKGNLIPRLIANTFYVSEEDLREMQEKCRGKRKARTSTGTKKKKHGLSETEPEPNAPDAAIQNLKLQKFNGPNTSRKNTGRKSGKIAQIVSLARQS
jgi:hypothetical protein